MVDGRLRRDENNATSVKTAAAGRITGVSPRIDFVKGAKNRPDIVKSLTRRDQSLVNISEDPFQAVIEFELDKGNGPSEALWYVHERNSTNETFGGILVAGWTNEIAQRALSGHFGVELAMADDRRAFVITPRSKGRFFSLSPITALYQPSLDAEDTAAQSQEERSVSSVRLKSVKLGMTEEQVDAFVARSSGYLLIEGAPGTGKTTVALQRVRFLLDAYAERQNNSEYVLTRVDLSQSTDTTTVVVPSHPFLSYVGQLIENELDLPSDLVVVLDDYIEEYVERVWRNKLRATRRPTSTSMAEDRARRAFFGLCEVDDLKGLWRKFEEQIIARLSRCDQAPWYRDIMNLEDEARLRELVSKFAVALDQVALQAKASGRRADNPRDSFMRMDPIFHNVEVRGAYTSLRQSLRERAKDKPGAEEAVEEFDRWFSRWLFWVYDPLHVIASYFLEAGNTGPLRVLRGTKDEKVATEVFRLLTDDFNAVISAERDLEQHGGMRKYGVEQLPWIAWLLRHALPESPDNSARFIGLPNAFYNSRTGFPTQWHHVIMDEAQDLSVAAAAFMSSLVHPKGALTVSADFHQAVSPICGMHDDSAITYGSAMRSEVPTRRRFQVNKRQTRENGQFMAAFHEAAFGEAAPFVPSDEDGTYPELIVAGQAATFTAELKAAIHRAMGAGLRTVAIIEVDGVPGKTPLWGAALEEFNVLSFKEYLSSASSLGPAIIVSATAEEVKGFEFDASVVLGIEEVERAPLSISKNQAYVALSRGMRAITILCRHYPPLLKALEPNLFSTTER